MDNKFAAQTIISESDWDPVRGLATENKDRLREYRDYFHNLLSFIDQKYIVTMSPNDVKSAYQKTFPIVGTAKDPVDALFNGVMEQLTVQ